MHLNNAQITNAGKIHYIHQPSAGDLNATKMKTYLYLFLLYYCLTACSPESKQQPDITITASPTTTTDSLITQKPTKILNNTHLGEYLWQEDPQGYFQTVKVTQGTRGEYEVSFSASVIKGKPGCTFTGKGSIVNDTLKVPIEWRKKKVNMTIFVKGDTVKVFTENFEDRFALNYYCTGGGSLAGDYYRVKK
jgi:hypothetical protein